jgi:putative SOS response-associated peptidase YedK
VPVDAFYEPNYESGKPIRWAIKRKDGLPFALAGICEVWKPVDGEPLRSFSMLTINATDHPLMKHFHAPEDEKRSIVYVAPDDYAGWLSAKDDQEARSFLNPLDPEQFTAEAAPKPPRAKLAKVVAEDRE